MPLTIRDGTIDGPVQFEPSGLQTKPYRTKAAFGRSHRAFVPQRPPEIAITAVLHDRPMSALERITDSSQTSRHVRKVPGAAMLVLDDSSPHPAALSPFVGSGSSVPRRP
jgi:hypothetical protein